MSDPNTFSQEQGDAIQAAAKLILENVDFSQLLSEAGVVLTGADSVTIEFSADVDEAGTMKKRPGDGKGCVTICVGIPPLRICWKNCDD